MDRFPPLDMAEWNTEEIPGYGAPSAQDVALARTLGGEGDSGRLDVDWTYDGTLHVRSRSWVGVVRLERITISIHPKHAGGEYGLLHMLDYTSGIGALHRLGGVRDLATGGRHIVDLLCLLLVEEAEDIIRSGVLSDYVTREESCRPCEEGFLSSVR